MFFVREGGTQRDGPGAHLTKASSGTQTLAQTIPGREISKSFFYIAMNWWPRLLWGGSNPRKHNGNKDANVPLIQEDVPLSDGTPATGGNQVLESPSCTQNKKRQKISAAGVASVVAEALTSVSHPSPLRKKSSVPSKEVDDLTSKVPQDSTVPLIQENVPLSGGTPATGGTQVLESPSRVHDHLAGM